MLVLITMVLVVLILYRLFKYSKKKNVDKDSPEELEAARESFLRVLVAIIATKERKANLDASYNQLINLYHSNDRYSFLYHIFLNNEDNFLRAVDDCWETYSHALKELEKLKNLQYEPESPFVSFNIVKEAFESMRDKCMMCYYTMKHFVASSSKILKHEIIIEPEAEKTKYYLKDMPMTLHSSNITQRTKLENLKHFVVIDVETTGLKAHVNEIVQLSAVKYESGLPTELFNTYIKPRKGILIDAQTINHITEDDVKNAPYIEQVMEDFNLFVGKSLPLVGHNIFFDLRFLFVSGFDLGNKSRKLYDTLELSRKVYDSPSYKLDYLCRNELGLYLSGSHDASVDCLATGELFMSVGHWLSQPR